MENNELETLNNKLLDVMKQGTSIEEVKSLLKNGADVNAINKKGSTVLMIATGLDAQKEMIELLIEHGADVNA